MFPLRSGPAFRYNVMKEIMEEINIARVFADKRREKAVTQQELARYMGVSKASVSLMAGEPCI